MNRRGFLAGMGALVAGGYSDGAMARRRLAWQQPIQGKQAERYVYTEKEMRAALDFFANRYADGVIGGTIVIADSFPVEDGFTLYARHSRLSIVGTGSQSIRPAADVTALFTLSGVSDLLVSSFRVDGTPDSASSSVFYVTAASTEVDLLKVNARGWGGIFAGSSDITSRYLTRSSIVDCHGADANLGGTLLSVRGGSYETVTANVSQSKMLGVHMTDLSAVLAVSVVGGCDFDSGGAGIAVTAAATSVISDCVQVPAIDLASGISDVIVKGCIGTGADAITAVSADGWTVVDNRNFTAYPTAGAGDVLADNQ